MITPVKRRRSEERTPPQMSITPEVTPAIAELSMNSAEKKWRTNEDVNDRQPTTPLSTIKKQTSITGKLIFYLKISALASF